MSSTAERCALPRESELMSVLGRKSMRSVALGRNVVALKISRRGSAKEKFTSIGRKLVGIVEPRSTPALKASSDKSH